ncbi:MAG: polysaccharide deacetylase family protein [Fusicatenibacter sp.]
MKRTSAQSLLFLALGAVTILSVFYQFRLGKNLMQTSSSVGERELPIYSVEIKEPKIALTFDAAWGNEDTAKILEILDTHQVKATFFITGGWAEQYPEDVSRIYAAGHDLGNHSQSHKNMSQLSGTDCRKEILAVHDKVKELTGYEMFLFRPPYGDYNNQVINNVKACGYYPIQWSVDSLDWKNYGAESILQTVTESKELRNGAIILCHNGAKYTADALDSLITALEEKGYTFVPVSELIYRDNYHMDHTGRQFSDEQAVSVIPINEAAAASVFGLSK